MKTLAIEKVVNFVRDTHPYAGGWKQDVTKDWISFFMVNGLIAVVTDNGQTIDGLLLFRTVSTPEDGQDQSRLNYDPKGNTVWLDYCYATSRKALKGLTICAAQRLGLRTSVAWERALTSDRKLPVREQRRRLEVVTVRDFFRHFLGKELYEPT